MKAKSHNTNLYLKTSVPRAGATAGCDFFSNLFLNVWVLMTSSPMKHNKAAWYNKRVRKTSSKPLLQHFFSDPITLKYCRLPVVSSTKAKDKNCLLIHKVFRELTVPANKSLYLWIQGTTAVIAQGQHGSVLVRFRLTLMQTSHRAGLSYCLSFYKMTSDPSVLPKFSQALLGVQQTTRREELYAMTNR